MKTVFSIVFLFLALSGMSQNQNKHEWHQVDSLSAIGQSQSALDLVIRIYDQSKSASQSDQFVKASLYRMKLESDFGDDYFERVFWRRMLFGQRGCTMGEDTFYSIPLDEDHPPVPVGDPAFERTKASVPLNAQMPVDVLAQFVEALMNLPVGQRDVIAWRFQCLTYKEIAERQGTSIQLAEMRHKIAMRDYPILRTLFPEKVAKRRRRLASHR